MRGVWSVALVVLVVTAWSGCFEDEPPAGPEPGVPDPAVEAERAEPRVFGARDGPMPLLLAVQESGAANETFPGSYETADLIGADVVRPVEVARHRIDHLVPAEVPVVLTLVLTGATGALSAEVLSSRIYHLEDEDTKVRYKLARGEGEELWVSVQRQTVGFTGTARVSFEFDLQVHVEWVAPALLTSAPVAVFLDPSLPVEVAATDPGPHGFVLVEPGGGVVYRDTDANGTVQLPDSLGPARYILVATGAGPVNLTGGFSGIARPVALEAVVGDRIAATEAQAEWSTTLDAAPWRVGYARWIGTPVVYPGVQGAIMIWYEGAQLFVEPGSVSFGITLLGASVNPLVALPQASLGVGTYAFQVEDGYGVREYATVHWRFVDG